MRRNEMLDDFRMAMIFDKHLENLALARDLTWVSPVPEVLLLKCLRDHFQLPKSELIFGPGISVRRGIFLDSLFCASVMITAKSGS